MSVAESASKDLKRVHLELGGKAPVVVFEDTDIAKAIEEQLTYPGQIRVTVIRETRAVEYAK